MTQPWIHDEWYSSPHTYAPQVQRNLAFPGKIELLDLSLDENGEGMSGAFLTDDQKLTVAGLLDELGIHRIGVLGYPVRVTPEEIANLKTEVATAKRIARTVKRARLVSLASTIGDIDRAAECGVGQVIIRGYLSHVQDIEYESNERKIESFLERARHARKAGLSVAMLAQGITRADVGDIRTILTAIDKEGLLDDVCLTDTHGVGTPQGFAYLVAQIRSYLDVPIQVHCHNHLGLGVANACFAAAAGASIIHTTVHGLGHFAGLAALEEVAVALRVGYGVELDLKFEALFELSQVMQRYTGIEMPPHKPVVGMRAFVMSNDAFYNQLNLDRSRAGLPKINTLPFLAEMVGNRERIFLGKGLTREAVAWNLELEGLQATAAQTDGIHAKMLALIEQKQGPASDADFRDVATRIISAGN
jgi:isopropylmalate/homocitrate/citramalate synthase